MALYRFAAGVIARGRGHSSTAAAAYRAGERITDERTGQTYDYSRRSGVVWKGIYAPQGAPEWMQDRAKLWNAVEQGEKRKDARCARDFIVCIPHELGVEQGRRLVGDFVREQFARKGFVADAAIHAPGKGGDERNIHAHILVTTRQVERGRFVDKKDRTQNEKATLEKWREQWAKLANRHLERAGFPGTLDHRSYEAQGIDREPGQHKTKTAVSMERRGKPTDKAAQAKASEARRLEIAEIRAELATLEAPPEAPAQPTRPANDEGRPEPRPANQNAAERPPVADPPILKAAAPAALDPARPIGLAAVAEPPPVPAPTPSSTPPPAIADQKPAAATLLPAAAEAPPRAEERPARVEVSPRTSGAADATPGPATTPPRVTGRTERLVPPKPGPKPRPAGHQQRTRLQQLFTAAAEWTRGLFARAKPAADKPKPAGAGAPPAAAVDRLPLPPVLKARRSEPAAPPAPTQRPTPAAAIIPPQVTPAATPPPPAKPPPAKPYRMSKAELLAEQEARRIRKANKHGHGI